MEELPEPISKQDKFLHNIADSTPDIDDIEAISRQDKYLKYIALNGGTSGGNANQKIGTWSPTLVNYTDSAHPNTVVDPTYSVIYSNAHYLKMGKLVYISFRIKVEITDIGTGYACVAGLPFSPDPDMIGQAFTIAENSAVTESEGVVYDGVVGQLYPDIYLETYNERHIPAISLRTDNGIQAKTFKVGTNWISYSGCYVCDDPYVPPQDSLVTIEHGGTSGKTADEARNNLNVYSKEEIDGKIPDINVVQETGTSETAVMSQKAVTNELDKKIENKATGEHSISIGNIAEETSDFSVSMGYNTKTQNSGIAIGNNANSDSYAISIGQHAKTTARESIAIGALAQSDTKLSVVIGDRSKAKGNKEEYEIGSVAIGHYATTNNAGCVAIGSGAYVNSEESVAIGHNSEADENNTVSVGTQYAQRRIVNVADPVNAQDATTKNYVDSEIAKIPSGSNINVVQETGQSETDVMSQKAVTDAIPTKLTDLSGTLPINQGGTGATNAKDAITNLGGVPIYTGVTSFISLPATTAEVIQAMPYPSILMTWIDTTSNSITDLPCNYGTLTIHKRAGARLQILYNRSYEGDINGNNFYFGNYNTLAKTVTWNKIFTSYSGCKVPIANGGTGANTSKQALINLGIPEIPSAGTYTLQVSDGVLSWVQS